jgi:hypothetical protein
MKALKKLPIVFAGQLNEVKLINFSIDIEEVADQVPFPLKVRDFGGRALISMVDVKLTGMHPTFLPKWCSFNYRHIAFRLLVEDGHLNEGVAKGIYFLQSFSNQPILVFGGNLISPYHLTTAKFEPNHAGIKVKKGDRFVEYALDETPGTQPEGKFYEAVRQVDRAYSTLGEEVFKTQIRREEWPLEARTVKHFSTNYFKTAKLESAYAVIRPIDYNWLPLSKVKYAESPAKASIVSPQPQLA